MTDIEDDNQQPKVLNPPKEIWLNYGGLDEDTEHSACGEVSWCDHEVDSTDVRYVLASEYEAVKAERGSILHRAIKLCDETAAQYINSPSREDYYSCDDARASVCEGLANDLRRLLDSEGKPVGGWAKQESPP